MEDGTVHAPREFRAPGTMTTDELGDSLARLVWESFSDFVAPGDEELTLHSVLAPGGGNGARETHTAEEALIFFMWAHTRGTQLAFMGRAAEETVRRGLDAMHSAVFVDMAAHGTPEPQLPIFEQRVGARYSEYAAAAAVSDRRLGKAVLRHLTGNPARSDAAAQALAERAIAVVNPLRDFLQDVELIS